MDTQKNVIEHNNKLVGQERALEVKEGVSEAKQQDDECNLVQSKPVELVEEKVRKEEKIKKENLCDNVYSVCSEEIGSTPVVSAKVEDDKEEKRPEENRIDEEEKRTEEEEEKRTEEDEKSPKEKTKEEEISSDVNTTEEYKDIDIQEKLEIKMNEKSIDKYNESAPGDNKENLDRKDLRKENTDTKVQDVLTVSEKNSPLDPLVAECVAEIHQETAPVSKVPVEADLTEIEETNAGPKLTPGKISLSNPKNTREKNPSKSVDDNEPNATHLSEELSGETPLEPSSLEHTSDRFHEPEFSTDLGKENLEVRLTKNTKEKGHVDDKTFYYIDPIFPQGWYIKVKLRTDLTKADSYFYPPCNTQLRSKAEIVKFLEGNITKANSTKPGPPLTKMPSRKELNEKDYSLTLNIEPEIFEKKQKIENKKKKRKNWNKCNGTEESGNSDRKPGYSKEIENPVDLVEHCFKVPTMENLRMLRSGKNVKSSKSPKWEKKHKPDSLEKQDEKNNLDSNQIKSEPSSEVQSDVKAEGLDLKDSYTKILKNEEKSESADQILIADHCEEDEIANEIDKSTLPKNDQFNIYKNATPVEDVEKESNESKSFEPTSPVKRTLRSTRESIKRKTMSKSTELVTTLSKKLKLRSTRSNSRNETEDDVNKDISASKEVIASAINQTETSPITADAATTGETKIGGLIPVASVESTTVEISKQRPSQRSKLRGPASKRKYSLTSSDSEEDDHIIKLVKSEIEDTASSEDKIHSASILKSSCSASVVNLFNRRLLETPCGHCTAAGQFSPETLEVDLPSNRIFIECVLCSWTTVRKISVNNKVLC